MKRWSLRRVGRPSWRGYGWTAVVAALGLGAAFAAEQGTGAALDLSASTYPALGATSPAKVEVAWNRYYDAAGLAAILKALNDGFPGLTKLYSIGKSFEGREIWCLELTSEKGGPAGEKPGMFIDGNIHGNEVQGGEVVAYTAWYLCHQYGKLPAVTELLDRTVFYLLPTVNPDGRDRWLTRPNHNPNTSRSGNVPLDNDRDGVADEDDYDDLDGDGAITQMRKKDPNGRWKRHPKFPDLLMVPAEPDEVGEYTLLGSEGWDNDGDGLVNEDPVGGYDANRNWAWDWQPSYVQSGAMEYPFSLPETHAVARFVLERPNLAAAQSYHNFGGMILRGPGREGGRVEPGDDRVLTTIAQRGERMLPFYRSMVIHKDLYTVWGGEVDWLYNGRGILTFTSEIWSRNSLYNLATPPTREDEAEFLKHVLLNEGLTPWREFEHPTYGTIEIGGTSKMWGRVPPSFLLEQECHRNMAFTLYHAAQMPQVMIDEVSTERIGEQLYRVWVSVRNGRLIPTRTDQDVKNRISPPDVLTFEGPGVKVLSAGVVVDRYTKRVEPVKRRPHRVEIDSIPGMGAVRVQYVVKGSGAYRLQFNSAKGGKLASEHRLDP